MKSLSSFSIIILSAGIGKRLGIAGKKKPKSLLQVNKKTLLGRILLLLKKRKAEDINIIVGYKSKMIIEHVKKIKGIKVNFIKVKNYRINGHGCSWHSFKKTWMKKNKPILLLHSDIIFNPKFLDNICSSKRKNVIGIHSNNKKFRKKSLMVEANEKDKIKSINFIENMNKYSGEIIGINKISRKSSRKIFSFMDKFLIKKNKKLSWELVIDSYIKKTNDSLHILRKQNYSWANINYLKDYIGVKKFYEN